MSSLDLLLGSSCGRCPMEGEPLPSTCPDPHACRTCPSPCSQPRWSLPGQLSCLPHASAAPRTGPCGNPAGRGASKPGSSWDAWGHWGWGVAVVLSWRPSASIHMWGRAAWGSEDRELEERSPGQESPTGSALTPQLHTKSTSWPTQSPPLCALPTHTASWAERPW